MSRSVVAGTGVRMVLSATQDLGNAIDMVLALAVSGAFMLLDYHARAVIACTCTGCIRGREAAGRCANLIIENAKLGIFPPDLVAVAKAFNKGRPVDDPKVVVP